MRAHVRRTLCRRREGTRRLLVEQARRKSSLRAGGQHRRAEMTDVDPEDVDPEMEGPQLDLLALNEALDTLAMRDPRAFELVKLRVSGGLTTPQAAEALGISVATAENDWAYAKCWLRVELSR
jgi:DNA-directed RNA polymerase specialized sigma24 family protein